MKDLPLFGAGIGSDEAVVTAQKRLNCYYDVRPEAEQANIIIRGTPGLVLFQTLQPNPASPIRGLYAGASYLYAVAGATLFQVPRFGGTPMTYTLNSTSGYVDMADNGRQLMIVDGVSGYILSPFESAVGTLTAISDPAFPRGCQSVAFVNGFFVVEKPDTGQFYLSNSYDGTKWDGAQFATANELSDKLLRCFADHGYLFLYGSRHIEIWQDTGQSPFPFTLQQGLTEEYGLAAAKSVARVNTSTMFLGLNPTGHVQVFQWQDFQPVVVSTPDLDGIINGFSFILDAVALSYSVRGHHMYQVTFQSANRSFLYDTVTGMWSEVSTGMGRHAGQFSCSFPGQTFVSDVNSPLLYNVVDGVFTDNGQTITRQVRTRHINDHGNDLTIDELFLELQKGFGPIASPAQMTLRVSKDGGNTWGAERWVSIGEQGQYLGPRAIWRRFGSAKDFVFEFTLTDAVPFTIVYGAAKTRSREQ